MEDNIQLPHGEKTLKLLSAGTGTQSMLHVNWIRLLQSTSSGVVNWNKNTTIKIYPNPGKDEINILASDEINTIVIMDLSGRIVKECLVKDHYFKVPVSALPPAAYLVRVHLAGRIEYATFIKIS